MARQLIGRSRSPRSSNISASRRPVASSPRASQLRLAVDWLDDAPGEVEVAADQRLDVPRLDAMFPVLGEVSDVPIELMVRARQSDQPALVAGSAVSLMYTSYICDIGLPARSRRDVNRSCLGRRPFGRAHRRTAEEGSAHVDRAAMTDDTTPACGTTTNHEPVHVRRRSGPGVSDRLRRIVRYGRREIHGLAQAGE